MAADVGAIHGLALSSGTAALHLALDVHGVGPGDRVSCRSMTLIATANAVRYLGVEPTIVDASDASWNLDIELVVQELADAAAAGPW